MAEATKLTQIEKKMDMSLEDLIKMNRKGKPAGAKPKAKASVKAAPKTTVAKAGVAGKRQAIKLKKAAKATGGTPVAGAKASGAKQGTAAARGGGIAKKRGIAVGGGLKQSMAQKILSKARTAKQLGKQPQKLQAGGMKKKAVMAAKQSPAKKQRHPVQFNGGGGGKVDLNMTLEQSMRQRQQANRQQQRPPQQQQQQATQLSRKQKLKLKKRQQQQQQQAAPAPALSKAASRKAKRQQLQQQQQLRQTQRGGVQKRGGPPPQPQPRRQPPGYAYAPQPYSGSPDWRRGPPQQHMRAPRARPPPRMAPPPQPHYYDDDGGYDYEDAYAARASVHATAHALPRAFEQRAGPRRAVPALGADPEVLEQRAAMAALRLQLLEDALHKAERRQHIHQQSQMNSGDRDRGAGGVRQPENQPAPAAAAPRATAQAQRGGVMPRAVSHGGMGGRAAGRAAMDMDDDYGY